MQKLYNFLFPKKLTRKIAYWMVASLFINFLIVWLIPNYLNDQQKEKVLKDFSLAMLLLNEHAPKSLDDLGQDDPTAAFARQEEVQKTIDNLAKIYPNYYIAYQLTKAPGTLAYSYATPDFLLPPSPMIKSITSKPDQYLILINEDPYYYKSASITVENTVVGYTWAITKVSQDDAGAVSKNTYILLTAVVIASFLNYFIWKHFIRIKDELANLAQSATDPESKTLSINSRFSESLPEVKPILSLIKQFHQSSNLKAVGQFASNVVHEIKNPLTTMRGFSQLLQAKLTDEQSQGYIKYIIDEIDRLNKLAIDFLRLTRSSDPKPEWVSIRNLYADMNKILEGKMLTGSIQLMIELDHDNLYALSDPNLLRQVLLNLLLNAMQAMEQQESGKITLRARLQYQEVLLEIADTGPGIPADRLEKIFEPFFTTKDTGTGLGLSFSKQSIEKQGGQITVQSEVGVGTTFNILLPGTSEISQCPESSSQKDVS